MTGSSKDEIGFLNLRDFQTPSRAAATVTIRLANRFKCPSFIQFPVSHVEKGMCYVVCFEKFSCVQRRCHAVGLIVGCRGRREVC